MIPPRLQRYFPLLRAVASIKDKRAQQLVLKHLKKHRPFVVLLRELAENTIQQNIRLTKKDKKKLNRHAEVIKSLVKKKKVEQSGGFLGVIVPLLAAEIAGLVARHVSG